MARLRARRRRGPRVSYLDDLSRELASHGIRGRTRRRIVAEFDDHLRSDPEAEQRLGSPTRDREHIRGGARRAGFAAGGRGRLRGPRFRRRGLCRVVRLVAARDPAARPVRAVARRACVRRGDRLPAGRIRQRDARARARDPPPRRAGAADERARRDTPPHDRRARVRPRDDGCARALRLRVPRRAPGLVARAYVSLHRGRVARPRAGGCADRRRGARCGPKSRATPATCSTTSASRAFAPSRGASRASSRPAWAWSSGSRPPSQGDPLDGLLERRRGRARLFRRLCRAREVPRPSPLASSGGRRLARALPRRPESRPAGGRPHDRGAAPRDRRRRLRQDASPHAPGRPPARNARREAERDPRDHVHEQGRGGDARAARPGCSGPSRARSGSSRSTPRAGASCAPRPSGSVTSRPSRSTTRPTRSVS